LEHENYKSFVIDDGFIRDWLFTNIDTDVMVMTMPDLHQYQVKKSKYNVHYVYVQHSLVSLHMVYRPGAFDYYNTIFCAGPHHIKEMRAIEALYGLPEKRLVEHGYARLDAIIKQHKLRPEVAIEVNAPKHILIAPSWGENGTIETGVGEKIVDELLARRYRVTLRPHPQTIKFARSQIDAILLKYRNNPLFDFEDSVAGQESLHSSDLMICDWSGAALDYALGLKKPVLFVDVPRKINDPGYEKLLIEPIESSIRNSIGIIVAADFTALPIEECLQVGNGDFDVKNLVFNVGVSDKVGAQSLLELF
jgi:CDP-glycerol glycerophosphotransferase (TagB/SpsB family)